ncbi:hypothetical protein JCM16303_002321, partial [Sporobolomyces ruberrimus]
MSDPPSSLISTERTPLLRPTSGGPAASSSSTDPSTSTLGPSSDPPSSLSKSASDPTPTPPNTTDSDSTDDHPKGRVEETPLRKALKFCLIWGTVTGFVVFAIVQSLRRGNGEFDWKGALKKAGGGGLAGAMSMILQVLLLLPLRTIMNYQYRHGGTSFLSSYHFLLSSSNGNYSRFYAGLLPALVQGPVARFGDTASNTGVLALMESNEWLKSLPTGVKTAVGSALGALFRMVLMPVDTLK